MLRTALAAVAVALTIPTTSLAPFPREQGDAPRSIEIVASRYAFTPPVVEVRRGELLELVLRSTDTDHGLAIKAYHVKVRIPKGGATVHVQFVAERAGRFPFECSEYCGSGHKRMRGELVVLETEG
jgi:cytochrome c oxidase subunit 2